MNQRAPFPLEPHPASENQKILEIVYFPHEEGRWFGLRPVEDCPREGAPPLKKEKVLPPPFEVSGQKFLIIWLRFPPFAKIENKGFPFPLLLRS